MTILQLFTPTRRRLVRKDVQQTLSAIQFAGIWFRLPKNNNKITIKRLTITQNVFARSEQISWFTMLLAVNVVSCACVELLYRWRGYLRPHWRATSWQHLPRWDVFHWRWRRLVWYRRPPLCADRPSDRRRFDSAFCSTKHTGLTLISDVWLVSLSECLEEHLQKLQEQCSHDPQRPSTDGTVTILMINLNKTFINYVRYRLLQKQLKIRAVEWQTSVTEVNIKTKPAIRSWYITDLLVFTVDVRILK